MLVLVTALVVAASPVLVMDPTGDALAPDARAALGARAVRALIELGVPDAMGQGELNALLDNEAQRQAVGCDEVGCLAQIADAFGAERAVMSRVSRVGGQLYWHVQLVDAREGRVLARGEAQARDGDGLIASAVDAHREIAGALGGHASMLGSTVLWPALFVSAAVVVGASGVAFDVLSPSSHDGAFGAADLLGPTAYVATAGLVVGAFFNPFTSAAVGE